MPGPMNISEQTKAEAAAWLARIRSEAKTPADENGFRQWLVEDPSHAAAFEAMNNTWETLGVARRAPLEDCSEFPSVSRRRLVLAGGAVAAAGAVLLVWRGKAEAKVFETGVGEQHHVVLADGTQVFLDTSSRLRAHYSDTERSVELEFGRCNFDVIGDEGRPFVIQAAAAKIVAGHTTVDVARDGKEVNVVLVRGAAAVSGGALVAEKPCILTPGDRLTMGRSGYHLDRPDMTNALAWQTGQIVFENTTLAQAADELNRYSTVKLEADAPSAALRISGVFKVGDNLAFSRLAAQLLPIAVQIEADRVLLTKTAGGIPKT